MTDNHTELCERLRQASTQCSDCGMYETSSDFDLAVSMIESQAARIQKQALEYVSLQAQCDEHLARVSRLEILLDSERATNKALSDENAILADLQPQELLARVAELDAACKTLERARATDPVCVKWYADQFDADQVRIAELEKERDALIHDNAQLLKAASTEATLASEVLAERDALKADAERYRWLRQDRTEDQTRAVIDIIIDNCDEYMDDAIDAALQAEKETRS